MNGSDFRAGLGLRVLLPVWRAHETNMTNSAIIFERTPRGRSAPRFQSESRGRSVSANRKPSVGLRGCAVSKRQLARVARVDAVSGERRSVNFNPRNGWLVWSPSASDCQIFFFSKSVIGSCLYREVQISLFWTPHYIRKCIPSYPCF